MITNLLEFNYFQRFSDYAQIMKQQIQESCNALSENQHSTFRRVHSTLEKSNGILRKIGMAHLKEITMPHHAKYI